MPPVKPSCKYGGKCYRRNPDHLRNFSHPDKTEEEDPQDKEGSDSEAEKQSGNEGSKRGLQKEDSEIKKPLKKRKTEEEEPKSHSDDEVKNDGEEDESGADEDQLESPEDVKESIKMKFLVEMPDDFYHFWDFCSTLNSSCPQDSLKCLKLKLVGPFDILSGKHKKVKKNKHGRRPNFWLHHRYYFDPPEFQTVLASQESDHLHFGYFRDDPNEMPVFVASNSPGSATIKEKISQCGENIFAAVHIHATKLLKTATPFSKTSIQKLIKSLESAASKHHHDLSASTKQMKERQKKVVCPSFHGAGIVVPVDENEIGYRPVPETPGDLKKMLRGISEAKSEKEKERCLEQLQELITLIQFANDECDYGEGLELGIDLFSFGGGKVFHPQISILLPLAYQLLNRSEFATIISAHLKRRRAVGESVDELLCE